MFKAPAGGIVSPVNGQFYNGGEFLPDTGLYCGKAGIRRAAKRDTFAARGRYIESVSPATPGAALYEIMERDARQSHISYSLALVVATSEKAAVAAFGDRPRTHAKRV